MSLTHDFIHWLGERFGMSGENWKVPIFLYYLLFSYFKYQKLNIYIFRGHLHDLVPVAQAQIRPGPSQSLFPGPRLCSRSQCMLYLTHFKNVINKFTDLWGNLDWILKVNKSHNRRTNPDLQQIRIYWQSIFYKFLAYCL